MAAKEYRFMYGKAEIPFNLDPQMVMGELTIKDHPPLKDPVAEIQKAIRNPIQSKPFREIVKPSQTVCFLVNDPTRVANSHVFMPILLNELNSAGIPDKDMFIMFAVGAHRMLPAEEMAQLVGAETAKRVKMYNSDARNPKEFKYAGRTSRGNDVYFHKRAMEADHNICTGSIVYHFFAGFGGGRKAMFPGVTQYESICRNHALMLEPGAVIGKLKGNPAYDDQVEATEMKRPSFLLNVVLNEKKEFLKVYAGDYLQAHRDEDARAVRTGAPPRQATTVESTAVFSGPGSIFDLLGTLPKGSGVRLLEEQSGWVRIGTDRIPFGWVHADFVRGPKDPPGAGKPLP